MKIEKRKLADGKELVITTYDSTGRVKVTEIKDAGSGHIVDLIESEECTFDSCEEAEEYIEGLAELHGADQASEAKEHLEKLLKESKLPDVAKDRLRKQFEKSQGTDGMTEAIDDECKYLAKVAPGKARGLGESEGGGDYKPDLKKRAERFQKMGLSEAEAEHAAIGRAPYPRKSTRKERFQQMGLSEAEAEIAARGYLYGRMG